MQIAGEKDAEVVRRIYSGVCDEICPENKERAVIRLQCLSNEPDRLLAGCHKPMSGCVEK